jgi:D-3-phosphoglycerate dehydrogenase / 2-oxoglutarate reductase
VREYLTQGVIQNAVNVPSVSFEEYEQMLPFIALAERLGTFLAQSGEGSVEEIAVGYSGEIADWKTELIRNAAVAGALNQMAHEKANLVNAASIAEERGIRVTERKKSRGSRGAANTLSMMIRTGQSERKVRGTVLHGNTPRLLRIDDIDVEAPLEGNVIYLRNRDIPGVVGRVGTVLGQHNINIGNFSLGRAPETHTPRTAVAVIQVDNEITEAALNDLRHIDAIDVAEAIRFTETPHVPNKAELVAAE